MDTLFCTKNTLSVIVLLLSIRLFGSVLERTFFVPDEYWQSLEVAHKMTFGYGYLTWEWTQKIRSYAYPFVFHILYCLFPYSVVTPKILQALVSTVGDLYTIKLSHRLFGSRCAKWTLFNVLSSWFLFYCSTRTITNMTETSLTSCGLYFYPWPQFKNTDPKKKLTCRYLIFAGASALVRPTAVVFWLPLYFYHVWREKDYFSLAIKTIFYGTIIFSVLMLCDRYFYGEWVFTPYNFFLFNWKNDIGAFYGQHNAFWYFYSGLPAVLGVHLIPFVMGGVVPRTRYFYALIFWVISVFSLLSHKEFRFLLPVLPISLIVCSAAMAEATSGRILLFGRRVKNAFIKFLVSFILLVNIPFSLYMVVVHQKGTIDATLHLAHRVGSNSSVLFLMPCHSIPYYSYIHQNITMKFLTCEPNLNSDTFYEDEADVFYRNPRDWLDQTYAGSAAEILPSHIILFNSLVPRVTDFLEKQRYVLCYKTFHSHFPEKRTGKFVEIYCR